MTLEELTEMIYEKYAAEIKELQRKINELLYWKARNPVLEHVKIDYEEVDQDEVDILALSMQMNQQEAREYLVSLGIQNEDGSLTEEYKS